MLNKNQVEMIALQIAQGKDVDIIERLATFQWYGKMYSKGRPRFSGNGHAFTPPNTRKYEKELRNHFTSAGESIIRCPVGIYISMFDPVPKSMGRVDKVFASKDLIYSSRGDLDNRAKSILDAGNGVIYSDDSQIVELIVSREYGFKEGFTMSVKRMGLSVAERNNIATYLRKLERETTWNLTS